MMLNFSKWCIEIINEDFKSQRQKFIGQGVQPDIVDRYIQFFKEIRDKKYKELFAAIPNVKVPPAQRNNIDAYSDFHELEAVVDYVKGQRDVQGVKFTDVKFDGKPIYNENGLEIYYAETPRACIQYKGNVPYGWCIARSDASNLFYTYRFKEHEPAFYFVKDVEKTKAEFGLWNATKTAFSGRWRDKYHFFVVQVLKNADLKDPNKKQYIVTSAQNDGDLQMSWNEILRIEPKLQGLEKILVPKPLSETEKADYKRFIKGVDDATFAKLDYNEKSRYLDIYVRMNRPLTDVQFQTLPEDLKNKYVSFGVGLSDGQYNQVKQDRALLKRYNEITLRKIEEVVKNPNQEIQLKPSEISIFLENKPDELFKMLETAHTRTVAENLLANINSEGLSKVTPEQQQKILTTLHDWEIAVSDPAIFEKVLGMNTDMNRDYLTNDIAESSIANAFGAEAKFRIAEKIAELVYKRHGSIPLQYIKAFMLSAEDDDSYYRSANKKFGMKEYLDNIALHLAQHYELDEEDYERLLMDSNSEKLAHFLVAKYGKELSHDLLLAILNHVDNKKAAKLAFQMRDKLDQEDVQHILQRADVDNEKLYDILGHHPIVLDYPDGYKWVFGEGEGQNLLIGPDKQIKVKLTIGNDGAWIYSGGPSRKDLLNKAFHAGTSFTDLKQMKKDIEAQYQPPSKWNDYILDFMIRKPDVVKSVSARGGTWSVGDFTPQQREKLFKDRPDLLPPVNMKTSDGYIWIKGAGYGKEKTGDENEYTLLDDFKPVLRLALRSEGNFIANGSWIKSGEEDMFDDAANKEEDHSKYSLATVEFILHNNIEHFDFRGRNYGWQFTDMLPEHQHMILQKYPDFLEPIPMIKKIAKGNRPQMLSQMGGSYSMEMFDNDNVVVDKHNTISSNNLLDKRRFANLPGSDEHRQQIVDTLHYKIHGEYGKNDRYDFEKLAKQGLPELQAQFPFADEEMMNLAKKHGYRTSDAISHSIGKTVMPKVISMLYKEIKPFANQEFDVHLKDNQIYFTTPFDNVVKYYHTNHKLDELEEEFKKWRKTIHVDWERFISEIKEIERIADKEAFRSSITGEDPYADSYRTERY
jgi:hypothetical protein